MHNLKSEHLIFFFTLIPLYIFCTWTGFVIYPGQSRQQIAGIIKPQFFPILTKNLIGAIFDNKGAGDFQGPRQTMKSLSGNDTSPCPNGTKIAPDHLWQ